MLDQPGLGEIGDPTERPEGCADGGPTAPLLGSWLVTQGDPAEERCPRLAVTVLCCSCLLFHHCPSICPLPTPFPATPTPTFSLPHSLLPIFVSPSCSLFKGKKKSIHRAIRFANERAGNWEQREPEPKREQV